MPAGSSRLHPKLLTMQVAEPCICPHHQTIIGRGGSKLRPIENFWANLKRNINFNNFLFKSFEVQANCRKDLRKTCFIDILFLWLCRCLILSRSIKHVYCLSVRTFHEFMTISSKRAASLVFPEEKWRPSALANEWNPLKDIDYISSTAKYPCSP